MARSAMIRARTEPKLKHDVERILHTLGLSFTEAINLFFHQVRLRKGIPFDLRVPNKTTLQAMKETETKQGLVEGKGAQDLFKKLDL